MGSPAKNSSEESGPRRLAWMSLRARLLLLPGLPTCGGTQHAMVSACAVVGLTHPALMQMEQELNQIVTARAHSTWHITKLTPLMCLWHLVPPPLS